MKVITQRAFTSSFEPIRVKIGLAVSATQNMIIAATTTRIKYEIHTINNYAYLFPMDKLLINQALRNI